jgi:hypothetical protein
VCVASITLLGDAVDHVQQIMIAGNFTTGERRRPILDGCNRAAGGDYPAGRRGAVV